MIRTLSFFIIFWTGLFISILFLIPCFILSLTGNKSLRREYITWITSRWSKFTLFTAGVKVRTSGLQNIPADSSGCVLIANHESNFDILILISTLPFSPAFVAKAELMRFPFISSWMKAMECLSIDRGNPREARRKITQRINEKGMNGIVLFPEGTRNRGRGMRKFKAGSLKLIFQNKNEILPLTINGTYKAYEESNRIKATEVKLKFHPIIKTSDYQPKDFPKFLDDLQKIISDDLDYAVN